MCAGIEIIRSSESDHPVVYFKRFIYEFNELYHSFMTIYNISLNYLFGLFAINQSMNSGANSKISGNYIGILGKHFLYKV